MTQQSVPVKGMVIPFLWVQGAIAASKFYEKAFAAEVAHIFPPDETGRTMHVHLYINGSSLMFSDPYPELGAPYVPAAGFTLMVRVTDVDASYEQAIATGCSGSASPADMVWGDRCAQVIDPYGVVWAFVGPKQQRGVFRMRA